jgi:hypothetical protein
LPDLLALWQAPGTDAPPLALSFSKATFSAEGSDQALDMNDPSFWEKVLGAKPAQRLLSDLTEGKLEAGKDEYVTRFIGGAHQDLLLLASVCLSGFL